MSLTKEEAILYDRQLRLWGLQSQQKIRDSKLLIITDVRHSLLDETCKNLALTGINQIDIYLKGNEENINLGFFLTRGESSLENMSKPLNLMNPKLKLSILSEYSLDEYQLVLVINNVSEWREVNAQCNVIGVPFVAISSHGFYSLIFCDCGDEYEYLKKDEKAEKDKEDENKLVKVAYKRVNELFDLKIPNASTLTRKKLARLINPELCMFLAALNGSDAKDFAAERVYKGFLSNEHIQ